MSAMRLVWVAVGMAAATSALAKESDAGIHSFHFGPDNYAALMEASVFSSWNGGDPDVILRPGPKVIFYGDAQGCPVGRDGVRGGPVKVEQGGEKAGGTLPTGLKPGRGQQGRRWSPSFNLPTCEPRVRAAHAASFAHLNADANEGGLGLYTDTGPSEPGQAAVFGPFGAKGQGGTGANAHLEGSFLTFRQAWYSPTAPRPWRSRKAEVQVRSRQGVAGVDVGQGPVTGPGARQAKQQIIVALLNKTCADESKGRKRLCQFQYLFNTAVFRTGVTDWRQVAWFQHVGLTRDPAQGGVPVIHGPIPGAGATAVDADSSLPLYRSQGVPTQHETFEPLVFDLRIPFQWLINAQRVIVAASDHIAARNVTESALAAEFGSRWDDPAAWVLLSAHFAQEVFDADAGHRSFIGGALKELSVGPAPEAP